METITPSTPPPVITGEDKTAAIVSYLTFVGFIVAIILNSNKKTRLGAYHLRQTLGFFLTIIVGWIALVITVFVLVLMSAFLHFLLVILVPLLYLTFAGAILTLWIMGFIAAINGEMKPMPIVGPLYQQWFGTAFE